MSRNFTFLDHLILGYIIISTIIAFFIRNLELFISFISVPNAFLVPILLGKTIWIYLKNMTRQLEMPYIFFFYIGTILLTTMAIAFQICHLSVILAYIMVAIIISGGFILEMFKMRRCLVSFNLKIEIFKLFIHRLNARSLIPIVVAIIAGIIPSSFVRSTFPIGAFGVDNLAGLEFVQPVYRLFEYGIIDYWHTRSVPVLIASIPIIFTNGALTPEVLYWMLPFFTSSIFTLGCYLFVYEITQKPEISIMASLFSILLNTGHGVFFDTVYHIYKYTTLLTTTFPLALRYIYHFQKNTITKKIILNLFILTIFSSIIGAILAYIALNPLLFFPMQREEITPLLTIITLAFLILCSVMIQKNDKPFWFFIGTYILFVLIIDPLQPLLFNIFPVFIFSYFIILMKNRPKLLQILNLVGVIYIVLIFSGFINFPNLELWLLNLRKGFYMPYTIYNKRCALIEANSEIVTVFIIICLILLTFSKLIDRLMSFFTILFLIIYFAPAGITMLMPHHLINIFEAYIISVGLYKLLTIMKVPLISRCKLTFKNIKHGLVLTKIINLPVRYIIYFITGILLLNFVFLPVYERFSWKPAGCSFTSIYTEYELEAIKYLKKHVPSDVRIISDPVTMLTFTPLANKIWIVEAKMTVPITYTDEIRRALTIIRNDILLAKNEKDAYDGLQKLKDVIPYDEKMFLTLSGKKLEGKFVIIISGRTAWWLDQGTESLEEEWFPFYYEVRLDHVKVFLNSSYFKPIFIKEKQIYIFFININDA